MGSTDPRRVIETRHSVYSRIRWMGMCEWSVLFITCSNGTVLFIVKEVFFYNLFESDDWFLHLLLSF